MEAPRVGSARCRKVTGFSVKVRLEIRALFDSV